MSLFPNHIVKTVQMPNGQEITVETGKLAKQADGSVTVRQGNTILLATVCAANDARPGVDFLPLSVDYQEKFAAAGRIPGGFLRREGRLSDPEVLVSRLIDRALRPLFPDDYHCEIQINVILISADNEVLPDALAAFAASAALAVSDVPFFTTVSEVRVVKKDGQYYVNPAPALIEGAEIEMIVAASEDNIVMVEGEMDETDEASMLDAMRLAHEAIRVQCKALRELSEAAGATEKRSYEGDKKDEALEKLVYDSVYQKMYEVCKSGIANKHKRKELFKAIKDEFVASLPADPAPDMTLVGRYVHDCEKKAARNAILIDRIRLDGRRLDQIRPIVCEVDLLPSPHGSSLFTRGETQSLTTVTLGTKLDEQIIDGAMVQGTKKFLLHYNFPGFSTGEVKPNRAPGRREVGHGNLAWRALSKVMPPDLQNPYTVRVVSDILESNGSSSMATVCAGSLALMDAGIQIRGAVSGIAMGLITDAETGRYAVLSDILGDEDHLGDMDFKVAGTTKGITAVQMDLKIDGLSYKTLEEALEQARQGRLHILGEMSKALAEPREDYKPHAPRSITMEIPKEYIGAVIGPQGKIIQEMQRETNTTIVIEENDRVGLVSIFALKKEDMDAAVKRIKVIVTEPEVGEVFNGIVKSIQPFGAFVEILKGKEGLLHISEISWSRLESMDGVFQIGQEVQVKLTEIDKKTGKYRLSHKVLLPRPEGMPEHSGTRPPRREGGPDGERRGDRRDGDRRGGGPHDHRRSR